jgi:sugar phosphate isomerase/epimerase
MKFAVQLYSLREMVGCAQDFLNLFPKLKAMGFDGVEFAGYHGLPAEKIRAALDASGLAAVGTHRGLDHYLPKNLAATVAYDSVLGLTNIGVGGAPHTTPHQALHSAYVLKAAQEVLKPLGYTVYYHNHVDEFQTFPGGGTPMDVFLAHIPVQLDTCWSFLGGINNYDYILAHRAQIKLLHIKDYKDGKGCALGEGDVCLLDVVRAARELEMPWLILEDESTGQGLASVEKGAHWLRENA